MNPVPDSTSLFVSRTVYTLSRLALVAAAWVLYAVALGDPESDVTNTWTVAGASMITVITVVLIIAPRIWEFDYHDLLLYTVPFDLVALGVLTVGLVELDDPVYPALLALPVFYSYVVRRRELWVMALASAAVYFLAHMYAHPTPGWTQYLVTVMKGFAIIYVGVAAAKASERHQARRLELERSYIDKDRLSTQLSDRVSELQAVSQISEVIHSSLDFDKVGPLVLQIVQKVIDIPSCALFVIDKQKAETLFSASVGISGRGAPVSPPADRFLADPGAVEIGDTHFSCTSILDHRHMMVVFCSEVESIEGLTAEDRMVLQAVASELVVAVENSQLYKLTRRLAITDELTELHNYRHLQNRLDEEIERARRYRKDVSLIMIDTDDFKLFNDEHGHIAGDRALRDLGMVIRSSLREVDLAARYGGEEFAVVLPETDAAGAFVVAEKIRESVGAFEFADADGERGPRLTVSIGLASYPAHASDKEALLRQADDALYRAKNGGKNRVRSPQPRPRRFEEAQAPSGGLSDLDAQEDST